MSEQPIAITPSPDSEIRICSTEIATITEKRHDNVLRDIDQMIKQLDDSSDLSCPLRGTYTNAQNKEQPCYYLDKFHAELLVTGYSVPLRAKVIRRLHELEGEHDQSPRLPRTLAEALRLAADLEEQREQLALQVREQAHKVEFYDTVVESESVCQLAVAAQVLGLPYGRNLLFQRLRADRILITGGERHNLPYGKYTEMGLFEVKEHAYENPKTGQPCVNFVTCVTQKGLDWLRKNYSWDDTTS